MKVFLDFRVICGDIYKSIAEGRTGGTGPPPTPGVQPPPTTAQFVPPYPRPIFPYIFGGTPDRNSDFLPPAHLTPPNFRQNTTPSPHPTNPRHPCLPRIAHHWEYRKICVIQVGCNYSSMPRGLAKTPLLLEQVLIQAIYESVNWILYSLYNGMSPIRRQVVIWANADPLPIGPVGTNIDQFAIKKIELVSWGNVFEICLWSQCVSYDIMHYLPV